MKLVSAVRTAIRILKPLLDAMVAKDMSTFRQAKGGLVDTLRSLDTILIVANDTT